MASIDGLASGLNTSEIIGQLMQLERRGQVRLKDQQRQTETAITALRALNTKFQSLGTAARAMNTTSGWSAMTSTSSDPARVRVAASSGAEAGEVSFTVTQRATAEVWKTSGTTSATTDVVVAAGTSLTLTKDGVATSIATGDGTLDALVRAVNDAGSGVKATAVQVSPGAYALQLTSTTTGTTSISLTDAAGVDPFSGGALTSLDLVTDGSDAVLQVGVAADGTGGYQVTRKSNTIKDLLTGTTIDLLQQSSTAVVTVRTAADSAAVADNVAKMVDAVNAALGEIMRTGSYDSATKKTGVLHGDSAIRSLRAGVAQAVTGTSDSSHGLVGVSVQRDGTIAFDRAKFLAALEKDPAAVQSVLGEGGLASRLVAVAEGASRSSAATGGPGIITAAISSRERSVAALRQDITEWDQRLELREERLRAQFGSLEKALSAAQSQGQWLAGQIASLPTYGG